MDEQVKSMLKNRRERAVTYQQMHVKLGIPEDWHVDREVLRVLYTWGERLEQLENKTLPTRTGDPQEELAFLQSLPANVYELWRTVGQDPRDPLALLKTCATQQAMIVELSRGLSELQDKLLRVGIIHEQ